MHMHLCPLYDGPKSYVATARSAAQLTARSTLLVIVGVGPGLTCYITSAVTRTSSHNWPLHQARGRTRRCARSTVHAMRAQHGAYDARAEKCTARAAVCLPPRRSQYRLESMHVMS